MKLVDRMTASGQAVQRRRSTSISSGSEAGQGDQRQGAPVLGDRRGAAGSETAATYAAIEAVIPWDEFTEGVSGPSCWPGRKASTTCTVGENCFATLRRYTPRPCWVLELRAAPAAQACWQPCGALPREMNADNLRKVPADAPTAFIQQKPRWKRW